MNVILEFSKINLASIDDIEYKKINDNLGYKRFSSLPWAINKSVST